MNAWFGCSLVFLVFMCCSKPSVHCQEMLSSIESAISNWNVCGGENRNSEAANPVYKVSIFTDDLVKDVAILCSGSKRTSLYCNDTLQQTVYKNGIVVERNETSEIVWFVKSFDSTANGLKPGMEKAGVRTKMGVPRFECSHLWSYDCADGEENMIVLFFENDRLKTVFYSEHDCGLD